MWSTTTGPRSLAGAEAELLRGAIGVMVDHLVDEMRNGAEPICYAIDWFDQWDAEQRLWLLEQVTVALFGSQNPPEPSAMLDATCDAVFHEIIELVDGEIGEDAASIKQSWRSSVIDALTEQTDRQPDVRADSCEQKTWRRLITQVADAILGVRLYQSAESHRDVEPERAKDFLLRRGLPADYLQKIPPVVNTDRAQLAIDRIQSIVFKEL